MPRPMGCGGWTPPSRLVRACCPQKIDSTVWNTSFTRQLSPGDIRDAGHQGSMSRPLGNLSECSAVGLASLPWVNSDPVFLVQGWSVGGHDCNVPPNT